MRALNPNCAWPLPTPAAHLQNAGIDSLHPELVIDLLRAFSFQHDGWDAGGAIPHRKVRDRSLAGEGKNVIPFFDCISVIGKNLLNEDAGIPIVDADG